MAGSSDRPTWRPEADQDVPSSGREPKVERGPEPRLADRPSPSVDRPPPPPLETVDDRFPGLYDRTDCAPPKDIAPHTPPSEWVADRNPGYPTIPGRRYNCGDCSRASELTWRGVDTQAGALADPTSGGEKPIVMDVWSPGDRSPIDFAGIEARLKVLGPGSSAVVGVDWHHGGGHWFNVFNDNGVIKASDGQSGRTGVWPPTRRNLRFHEGDCRTIDAIFIDAEGLHLPSDHRK